VIKKIHLYILAMCLCLGLLLPVTVGAQNIIDRDGTVCTGKATSSPLCEDNEATKDDTASNNSLYGPDGLLTKIASLLAQVVGVAAVIMVIVGGFQYVLAVGDSSRINTAKNTILYALIGAVIAALAQVIVVFILRRL
jgi:hypothetical protein